MPDVPLRAFFASAALVRINVKWLRNVSTHRFLHLQLSHKLLRPRLLLFPLRALVLQLDLVLALHVLPHRPERLAQVLFVSPDDDLELADRLRLLRYQLVLLRLRRICGQKRAGEERGLEGKDLRGLRFDLAPRREQLLL